jgi:glycosyltransferase involved in cell wall biosynthesis
MKYRQDVTIVVPTYDQGELLERALDSIRDQMVVEPLELCSFT